MSAIVFCGSNLKKKFVRELNRLKPTQVVVFYDSKLKKQKSSLQRKVKGKWNVYFFPMKAHEKTKDLRHVADIYKKLSRLGIDRKAVLVAMGGGVIGDTIGFVASTYLRGVRWANIPTTVLSQVDSSLGGKNGVNLPNGKNLVGSFHQPSKVFVDFEFLQTLPEREMISGLGEILKYSCLNPKIYFPVLKSRKQILSTIQKLTPACVAFKMKLVKKDEFDEKGIRQILNLGHTFGHVLETYTGYKKFKHGEAVIWGLKFAALVSYLKEMMSFEEFREIMNLANKLSLPPLPKSLNAEKCYRLALKDKKSENSQIKMVLLKKRGKVLSNQGVNHKEFTTAIKFLKDMA